MPSADDVSIRRVSWPVLVAVPVLYTLLSVLNSNVFYPWASQRWQSPPGRLAVVLLPHVVSFLVIYVGVLHLWGHLRGRDVGLDSRRLLAGLAWTAFFWLAIQVATGVAAASTGASLVPYDGWARPGVVPLLVTFFVGQLCTNALIEEIFFRGFLPPQLCLRWRERLGVPLAFLVAMGVSQAVFALYHVPGRLAGGIVGEALVLNLTRVFFWGVVFLALYRVTGNLFVAIGFHALTNEPLPIWEPAVAPRTVLLVAALIVMVAHLAWQRRKRRVPRGAAP